MTFDATSYLAGKGLRGRPASGGREMTYACFFDCAEPGDSKKKKLYVNVEEGVYSCLTGETQVLTRAGIRPIADLAGGVHEVVTAGGKWVNAPFYHFGRQPVRTITLSRNGVRKTLRATSHHRWLHETRTRIGRRRAWATTDELRPGMILAAELPLSVRPGLDPEGIRHGIVFGDGTRGVRGGSSVVLHPPKSELAGLFDTAYSVTGGIRAGRLPRHYKDLPELSQSIEYLAGWLAGYIATDGTVDGSGNVSISSVSSEALRRVREVAAILGVACGTTMIYRHSGGSLELGEHDLGRVTLYGRADWLLLRDLHRTRATDKAAAYQRLRWRVVEVGGVEPEEDVFCAVVDGTESFVLDDFILTGNCKVCGATGGPYTLQKHFGDDPRAGTSDDAFTRRRILNWAADIGAEMLQSRDDVLLHLMNERGLNPETILERRIGFVGNGWSLTGSLPADFTREQLAQTGLVWREGPRAGTDYFYNHLLIPITSRGHVIQIRGRAWGDVKGAKYMSGPGESVRAYNIDSLDAAEEVVLTEGEFDAMRLAEVLAASTEERARKIAVVGLPGTSAWPEELDDYLADVKRIYLGFDSDEPGRIAAEKLRDKYGARARVLALPNTDGRKADWCVDEETEALSKRGWLHHDDVQIGDELWSLDPVTGRAGWRPVTKLYRKYRRRQMVLLQGKRHNSLTTAEHRWPVLTQAGQSAWRTTDTLRSSDRILTSAPPEDVPETHDDALVELVGWWVTEGYAKPSGGIEISQSISANPDKCERIRLALKALYGDAFVGQYGPRHEAFWREYTRSDGIALFTLSHCAAEPLHRSAPGCALAPGFLAELSQRQLQLLLDTIIDGDGWRSTVTAIAQIRPQVTAGIEMARVLAGGSFVTHWREPHVNRYGRQGRYETTFLRKSTVLPMHVATREVVEYEGIVWCPVIDGTTTWFARRGGTGYFTGNTEYLLPQQDRRGFDIEHPYAGHDAGDVLRLMSQAAGKRIHSVSEAGAAFRSYRATHEGLKTGWHQLDAAIHPGLLPGQVVFVLAKTGVGKTNILCNLAYQMRRHRTLFISLEMTREEVYHRLARIYWHYHPRASIQELEYALANVWICDENRLGEKDLMALVNEYQMETGERPDVVYVDYLGYYARGARGSSPYEKTSNAAMQLKADAKAGRLVIISPSQVNRVAKDGKPIDLDDARDSGAIEETGDFVIAGYRPDAALTEGIINAVPTNKLMLALLKSRHGGVGKQISLQFDTLTLALPEVGTRGAKIAEEHNILVRRGLTWEELRHRETQPEQLAMPGGAS